LRRQIPEGRGTQILIGIVSPPLISLEPYMPTTVYANVHGLVIAKINPAGNLNQYIYMIICIN
jgi:hypothetical protein